MISADVIPNHNPHVRAHYHFLATGERRDANWYRTLNQQDEVEDTSNLMGIFDLMNPNADGDAVQDDGGESAHIGEADHEADDCDDEREDDDDDEIDENKSVNDDDENEDVLKNNFLTAIEAFSEDEIKRVESDFHSYKKSVTSFTKKLQNVETMKAETFTKALHSFQSEIIAATRSQEKRSTDTRAKRVQIETRIQSSWVNGISKRSSTKRRSGSKEETWRTCSFCLPKSKKMKKAHHHSLSKSVSANRGAEKRTEMEIYFVPFPYIL